MEWFRLKNIRKNIFRTTPPKNSWIHFLFVLDCSSMLHTIYQLSNFRKNKLLEMRIVEICPIWLPVFIKTIKWKNRERHFLKTFISVYWCFSVCGLIIGIKTKTETEKPFFSGLQYLVSQLFNLCVCWVRANIWIFTLNLHIVLLYFIFYLSILHLAIY